MKARRRVTSRCRIRRRARRRTITRRPIRRKKRVTAPIIPSTSRGPPPSYFELLQEAVLTLKDAGKGASLPEIRRQLQRRFPARFDKASDKLVTTALMRLAERGKVIFKKGYRYRFNAPKVSRPKPPKSGSETATPSDRSGASSYTSTTRSGATTHSAPSDASPATDATDASRTSASSSSTSPSRSRKSSAKDAEAPKDAQDAPQDAAPDDRKSANSSGEDLSSSAASAPSTASRRTSSKMH